MKKFLSIFIALLLIVSLFATTAVAFAAEGDVQEPSQGETTTPDTPSEGGDGEGDEEPETPRDPVRIEPEILRGYLEEDEWFNSLKIEMGNVTFGQALMKDSSKIRLAFPNIQYVISGDPDYDANKGKNDKIIVEYCRPSESPKGQENWQNYEDITKSIRISSSGWYLFRIVIKDSSNEVLCRGTDYYSFYAVDTSRPVVSLSNPMKDKQKNGLTAGVKYSIPTSGLTSGSTDEMSSTTVNYKIYKWVNGAWTADPIYDSKTKEIAEGYKAFIDADGAITPSNDDISKADEPIYKIVYSVTDAYGFTGVANREDFADKNAEWEALEFNPEMLLKVVAAPAEDNKAVNVWEIVLFCIAGLSAVGIVVLLCIKPKEAAPAKAAANSSAKEDEAAETTDETQE